MHLTLMVIHIATSAAAVYLYLIQWCNKLPPLHVRAVVNRGI